MRALHLAASRGHEMAISALLEAAPNAECAARNGDGRAIRALLQSAPNQEVQEQMLLRGDLTHVQHGAPDRDFRRRLPTPCLHTV
eukprot:12938767-Prorocentrum_lima.AAC.1